jgi:hypothetical protein
MSKPSKREHQARHAAKHSPKESVQDDNIAPAPAPPRAVDSSATLPGSWRRAIADIAGWTLLFITAIAVCAMIIDPRNSWIHPELVGLATYLRSTRVAHPMLAVFDWPVFEPNASRMRFLSDLFQVLDAFFMRAAAIKIPAVNISTIVMLAVVP